MHPCQRCGIPNTSPPPHRRKPPNFQDDKNRTRAAVSDHYKKTVLAFGCPLSPRHPHPYHVTKPDRRRFQGSSRKTPPVLQPLVPPAILNSHHNHAAERDPSAHDATCVPYLSSLQAFQLRRELLHLRLHLLKSGLRHPAPLRIRSGTKKTSPVPRRGSRESLKCAQTKKRKRKRRAGQEGKGRGSEVSRAVEGCKGWARLG